MPATFKKIANNIPPAALNVNEAAKYLGISRANVYRLFKSGAIRPAKVGGRTLVRRIDADAFLEASIGNVSADRGWPEGRARKPTPKVDAGIFE